MSPLASISLNTGTTSASGFTSVTSSAELLAQKLAGRVVVGDRDIGAGNAFVARRYIEHGQRQLRLVGAQIANARFNHWFCRFIRRSLLRRYSGHVDEEQKKAE